MIEVDHLSKAYGSKPALTDISFSLKKGEVLGVMGKNGAGKTTLIKAILKEISHAGEIVHDASLIQTNKRINHENLYFVSDSPHIYDYLTAVEYIQFVLRVKNRPLPELSRILQILEIFGIDESDADKLLKVYSFGMRRKVVLAAGFLVMPDLMILDEPTLGLDISSLITLKKLILSASEKGMSFLITSHDPSLMSELCSSLVVLHGTHQAYYNDDFRNEKKPLAELYMKLIGENLNQKVDVILNPTQTASARS